MNKKRIRFLLLMGVFLCLPTTIFGTVDGNKNAESNNNNIESETNKGKEIVRINDFYLADGKEVPQPKEKLLIDGKEYKLKKTENISLEKGRHITREMEAKSKDDFQQSMKIIENGKKVTLRADRNSIKEVPGKATFFTYTQTARRENTLPDARIFSGENGKVQARLYTDTVSEPYFLSVPVEGRYQGDASARYVDIGGTMYDLTAVTPLFDGYEEALKMYLSLPADFVFQNAAWADTEERDGVRRRKALYQGALPVRDYTGIYVSHEDPSYRLMYTNAGDPSSLNHIQCTTHYVPLDMGLSFQTVIEILCGVLVFAAAGACLYFFLRRRRLRADE